jgi:hypothetical protein
MEHESAGAVPANERHDCSKSDLRDAANTMADVAAGYTWWFR